MLSSPLLFPALLLLQDNSGVSPILLAIIAIALIVVFFWVLLIGPKGNQPVPGRAMDQDTPVEEEVSEPEPVPQKDTRLESTPESETTQNVVVAAAATATASANQQVDGDDLEIIEGIGPKVAGVLRQAGVTTFTQLAEMEPAQILKILHAANLRLADPATWPEQARLAVDGDQAGLKALQDRLKGGREK
jgi:predicted flap endonuclease-1-like 5' DNA nuclease